MDTYESLRKKGYYLYSEEYDNEDNLNIDAKKLKEDGYETLKIKTNSTYSLYCKKIKNYFM